VTLIIPTFKLGKTPARLGAIRLKLSDYIDLSKLPTPPATFGHDSLVTQPLGMLGNDSYGDCVWAGAAHETMLWNAEAGVVVPFTAQNTLSDYSAVTGFDPNATPDSDGNNPTDQGTDMQQAAAYRQNTGILDANGNRHKVGAYLAIKTGDLEEHLAACYLFSAVGIGITFPSTAMAQFNSGQPWDVVPGSTIEGGHYIPAVARRNGMLVIDTWGAQQSMTDNFFKANNDESIVYLSPEMLTGGKSLEGFDLAQLNADLADLRS
jgi:hypothetical protein